MADTCCVYTVAGITINATSGNTLHTDFDEGDIIGLDGAPIRAQIDPQGQSDGGIVHEKFFGPRIITFQGKVLIRSTTPGDPAGYAAAVNSVIDTAVAALESFLNSTTTLAWTPSGGSPQALTVTYGMEGGEFQSNGPMLDKSWQFTLVAANP